MTTCIYCLNDLELLMSLSKCRVSVLMAVFNTVEYLEQALQSISDQSFVDFELIALDDGSTDGSTELLTRFACREPRLRIITRENRGLIKTRNELLSAAKCNLIAWMDSDDIATPSRLELQVRYFEKDQNLVCLGGSAQCIDPDGNALNYERYPLTHSDILIGQRQGGAMRFPTTMMRRDIALEVGGFREPFKMGEDFDLLIRMSEIGKMANLPDTIYLYRQHLKSVCAMLGSQWFAYRDQILALAHERQETGTDKIQRGEVVNIPKQAAENLNDLKALTYLRWSTSALENRNSKLASKYILKSIFLAPFNKKAWAHVIKLIGNKYYPSRQKQIDK